MSRPLAIGLLSIFNKRKDDDALHHIREPRGGRQGSRQAVAAKALPDPVVLALPRGGVPVAAEVARVSKAPLDLVMVRKIGVPGSPSLPLRRSSTARTRRSWSMRRFALLANVSRSDIDEIAKEELKEIDRRAKLYLKDRPRAPIAGRSAIVVDDGIATGRPSGPSSRLCASRSQVDPSRRARLLPRTPLRRCARRRTISFVWKRPSPSVASVSTTRLPSDLGRGGHTEYWRRRKCRKHRKRRERKQRKRRRR